jgi:hypothetical protein
MGARGHSRGGAAMSRISIGFDLDTFAEISDSATARQVTFAERVRQLAELGLETEKDFEAQKDLEASCCTNSQKAGSSNSISLRQAKAPGG